MDSLFLLLPIQQQSYQKSITEGPLTKQLSYSLLFLDVLAMYSNILAGKDVKPFNECAARCVHLSLQKERVHFLRGQ